MRLGFNEARATNAGKTNKKAQQEARIRDASMRPARSTRERPGTGFVNNTSINAGFNEARAINAGKTRVNTQ